MSDPVTTFQESILRHAKYSLGKEWADLSGRDQFAAVALTVRDWTVDRMLETEERSRQSDSKRLYYLSIEFLIGQSLGNNLDNLGLRDLCSQALRNLGANLEQVEAHEPDAALGNGGLGRLAACFLDSLATLGMPGYGYGINYEYGLFKQEIDDGYQREKPDNWLAQSSPWQIVRADEACMVPVYGRVERSVDRKGGYNPMWLDWKILIGIPHDMPVVGYGGQTVNYLRLYSASSSHDFDMGIFNDGDYFKAVSQKISSETISMVLYPSDAQVAGQELRLVQEYFLVACAVRDIVRRFERKHTDYHEFPSKVAIQLNDTHPSLTVAELMRFLVDERELEWDDAWTITRATLGYTNHTLLPEALERWHLPLLEYVLPRHLEIIREINRRLMDEVAAAYPGDTGKLTRMSLIEETAPPQLRMANLAIVGSHSVNGVAKIHTELVETSLVPDFYQLWPERFNNKTNGITQRRWLLKANPALARLITEVIGDGWITDLGELSKLKPLAGAPGFRDAFLGSKAQAKARFANWLRATSGLIVDPQTVFDCQVKRIHEYKRQLLNALRIIVEYNRLRENPNLEVVPRTYFFAGKAAPAYRLAKLIIKFINNLAETIDLDPLVRGRLKVVFLPEYNVSLAEKLIPASDVSNQISTAGFEASGTSNMKFMMNGALTVGTRDGATIEMAEEAGEENLFLFGLTVEEVGASRAWYDPHWHYENEPQTKAALDLIFSGHFNRSEPGIFDPLQDMLLKHGDHYRHLADLTSYCHAQDRVAALYSDSGAWAHKAILNVASSGKFSSDRTIAQYAAEIWKAEPCPVL